MEDRELVPLIAAKDQQAFRTLVDLYGDRVYNTALGLLQHAEDAEDIAQEVFIEVFQSIHKFRGDSRLQTWLYRIAVSKCLDLLKSRTRKKRFAFVRSLFGEDGVNLTADRAHFDHPGVLMENKEHASVLFLAVSKLPENQQTAFTLNKVEGLSYKEVAEIMDLSVGAIESLLVRANQNLRSLLQEYYSKHVE